MRQLDKYANDVTNLFEVLGLDYEYIDIKKFDNISDINNKMQNVFH